MGKITFDYSHSLDFISNKEIDMLEDKVRKNHEILHNGAEPSSDYLGWVDLPNNYDRDEYSKIKTAAKRIRSQSEVFLIVGIGGSYLGARAAIEMLSHNFYNELPNDKRLGPKIYYVGHNVSLTYLENLLENIDGYDVSINAISKSGTTTEPAIVFRMLRKYMEDKYGKDEASKRIYVTTDKNKGALKMLSDKEGYEKFVIPDDIGGRYSVLTPVGLLPMAVAGIDIDEVIKGAQDSVRDLSNELPENPAYKYATIRNILYLKGKTTEIMVNYEPCFFYFGEWYKQLFGESEGKDGKGIFPSSLNFTTDLHSMGQYIQEGRKNIFETILNVEKSMMSERYHYLIEEDKDNLDFLNYLSGKSLDVINKKCMEASILAHVDGRVPNLIINIPENSPYYFGYLVYYFQKACAMSAYLLGVNPFDQPGVDVYKKNMFRLLGKPGY